MSSSVTREKHTSEYRTGRGKPTAHPDPSTTFILASTSASVNRCISFTARAATPGSSSGAELLLTWIYAYNKHMSLQPTSNSNHHHRAK